MVTMMTMTNVRRSWTAIAWLALVVSGCTVGDSFDDGGGSAAGPDAGPDDGTLYWETLSAAEEAYSTHLWIVDRAVDILARHSGEADAAAAVARMRDPSCEPRWQQGLFDADYKAEYNDGRRDLEPGASTWQIWRSGATWKSHFYDPATGTNYKGESSPVAKERALQFAADARALLADGNVYDGCYALGLALHYMTDITQPMHAANFTAVDSPIRLHSHVEEYTLDIQDRYARADWSGPTAATPDAIVELAAWTANAQWPAMRGAIEAAYGDRCWSMSLYWFDSEGCWQGDAAVDAAIGRALRTAQDATAQFLASVAR
ncbi:MAG: hypothetical protein D6689_06200 [Deltaproteobacteria bacterium]|nr:MAG: hypothetical protein D6689_06200 [Deltaproteobacteria bacterium]